MTDLKDELLAFVASSSKPVLFLGAGASVKAGLPTWYELIERMADIIREKDVDSARLMDRSLSNNDLDKAAQYFNLCAEIQESKKLRALKEILESYDSSELDGLARFGISDVVTTNYDRSIIDAIAKSKGSVPVLTHYDDATLKSLPFVGSDFVVRLHGRSEDPKNILLTSDSLRAASESGAYRQTISYLFTRRQILFIGYSFADPAIVSVLKALELESPDYHEGAHLALLSSGAPSDLIGLFERWSIKVVKYSPEGGHAELWGAIDQATSELASTEVPGASQSQDHFSLTKRYLATCFARTSLKANIEPLWSSVVEGVIAGQLMSGGDGGCYIKLLTEQVRRDFGFSDRMAVERVNRSLARLSSEGLVRVISDRDGEKAVYVGNGGEGEYKDAVGKLVDGVSNRFFVREGLKVTDKERECIYEIFEALILQRGWDLGAAFASQRVPDLVDIDDITSAAVNDFGFTIERAKPLSSAIANVIEKPSPVESELLVEVGRVSFALEILSKAPKSSLFFDGAMPETIYLDANVLMPAIVRWHPLHNVYSETLRSLKQTAAGHSQVRLCVMRGFVEEVVSHKQKALQDIAAVEIEAEDRVEARGDFFGSASVNVFIGAYVNYRRGGGSEKFVKFLAEEAPFQRFSDLRKRLENMGFTVVPDDLALNCGSDYPDILHTLETAYATALQHRRKPPKVIEHDAKQLAILNSSYTSGRRAILATADRSLRGAIDGTRFSHLSNAMVSHVGFTQLVDLLISDVKERVGFSRLMWSSTISSDAVRVRNYLIDRALKYHDAAYIRPMHDLIDDIASQAHRDIEQRGLDASSEDSKAQDELVGVLSHYEDRFFEMIRLEVEKRY